MWLVLVEKILKQNSLILLLNFSLDHLSEKLFLILEDLPREDRSELTPQCEFV